MFVEVDNHTEPTAVVARKIEGYRRFFQRTAKDHLGQDVPFWSTLWDDSHRAGYPPLALVFAKNVSPETAMNRMKAIGDLSTACWKGTWHGGSIYDRAYDALAAPRQHGNAALRRRLLFLSACIWWHPFWNTRPPGRPADRTELRSQARGDRCVARAA